MPARPSGERDRPNFLGVSAKPGGFVRRRVPVGYWPDGSPVTLPILLIRGHRSGPTLYVQGALHGDELVGAEAVRKLAEGLPRKELRGTVVAVPVANPLGLVSRQRGWPGEARGPLDMNRLFPGDARGPLSSRIAHRIFHDVLVRCDYCIDLHGGMTGSAEAPFAQVVMLDDRHRTLTTRRKMAEAFGTELIYEMRQKERGRHAVFRGLEFSFAEQARLAGVPTLVVELGEGGRLNGSLVELASRGIQNVMVILGMLDLPIVKAPTRYRFQSVAILRPDRGGILTMDVRPGERVEKGTLVGRISDCLRVVERLRAPAKGIVQRVVTSAVTEPGADVLWIAQAGRS